MLCGMGMGFLCPVRETSVPHAWELLFEHNPEARPVEDPAGGNECVPLWNALPLY